MIQLPSSGAPRDRTFRDGSPCPHLGKYGKPEGGPRSCWRHLTDDERLPILDAAGDRCTRTYGDGRPCTEARRSSGPSASCWRHFTPEEKQAARDREAAIVVAGHERYLSEGNAYLAWHVPARLEGQSDLEHLRAFQAGRCAWCAGTDEPLVKDHDHRTELLRGLLCDGCNKAEGFFGRNITYKGIDRPHAWDLYRRTPPAALLSIQVRHANDKRCLCGCQNGVVAR